VTTHDWDGEVTDLTDFDHTIGVDAAGDEPDIRALYGTADGDGFDGPDPLFPGDIGTLPQPVRETLVTLLKRRYISAEHHPTDWRIVLENEPALQSRLNDLFLELVIDREYQVAYKMQATSETGTKFPTLLYIRAYSREETVLVIYLRRRLRASEQAGADAVFVDRQELLDEVATYRPPSATNRVRDEKAAANAVDMLVKDGLLLKTGDDDRYRISPIIEVLMPVEQVKRLADALRAATGLDDEPDNADDTTDEDEA
jgi:hypothetical protein